MKTTIRIQMVSIEMQGDAPEIVKALAEMFPEAPAAPKTLPPKQSPKRKRATKVTKPNGQN